MQQALDALVEVEQTLKQISAFKIYPKYYEAIEALRARLAQPEQQHSEQWWKHEVSNAWAEGYEKGRASVKQPEQEPIATLFGSLPVYDVPSKQEPVAWMHNFIDEVVIAHRPADLDRHPDRWTALYKDPTPCQTCEALARTVMMDQVSYDILPRHREPPTQDLSAPLTVNGVPMYPQREWQGLTDEQVKQIEMSASSILSAIYLAEAQLRGKNAV